MAKSGSKSKKKDDDTGKTGKEPKKKSGPKKKSRKGKKSGPNKETKKKDQEENTPAKNELSCQYCQKQMGDQRTLKIHERNCKKKLEEGDDNNFEAALLEIKDEFEDERHSLEEQFMKREDALQREVEEMRTVLRMEIDKHRKELDTIRKMERDVARVSDKQTEMTHDDDAAPPKSRRRAIDMIPTPLPDIPRKAAAPEDVDDPEGMGAPELPETAAQAGELAAPEDSGETGRVQEPAKAQEVARTQEPVKAQEVARVQEPAKAQEVARTQEPAKAQEVARTQEPARAQEVARVQEPAADQGAAAEGTAVEPAKEIPRGDIEEIVRSILETSEARPPAPGGGSEEMERKIKRFSDRMDSLDSKIEKYDNDVKERLENINKESNVKRIKRELDKLSDSMTDMMEDTGFGEELSVSKIPPTILEIVYQATLDDIHQEIVRTKGAPDAEKIARSALEEVRLKTSGSELFKFDGRKIVTENLAKSIEANLISAKQIQTTYDVLLDKLLETVPHHKAKNFKGMIKVKSQEFAVDRATVLTKEFNRVEKIIESTSQMIAAISAQFNARSLEVNESLKEIKDELLAEKADKEDITSLKEKLKERDEAMAKLVDDLSLLKAEMEMKREIESKKEKEVPEEVAEPAGEEKEAADNAPVILEAVKKGASSKTALMQETGLKEDVVLETVDSLIEQNKVIRKKAGKRIKYLTPEKEMEDKVKTEKRKGEKRPGGKEGKKEPEKKTGKGKKGVDEEKPVKKDGKEPEKKEEEKPGKKDGKEPEKKEEKTEEETKPEKDRETKKKEERAEEKHVDDDLPVIKKSLDQLSDDEKEVLDAMGKDGMSMSGIQSKVGKDMKRFALLRALRVLIDSGYVDIVKKGRMDLYKKVNVKKMDTKKDDKTDKEVK